MFMTLKKVHVNTKKMEIIDVPSIDPTRANLVPSWS